MTPTTTIISPQDSPERLSVLGTRIDLLLGEGGYHITLQSGEEGAGPPPHAHDWDEAFFILDGEVRLSCDGQTHHCSPGTFVHVPAGRVHGFRYGPGGGRMLEITGSASQAVALFRELSATPAPERPDPARIAEIFGRHGVALCP
ncbi:cupin domain-containing protein [Halomonas salifodinae]|uniref:cupin domain-containing protein n=1 Tax=Halomonas salifodinae TaxID=438745 RepID=UPI0033AF2011